MPFKNSRNRKILISKIFEFEKQIRKNTDKIREPSRPHFRLIFSGAVRFYQEKDANPDLLERQGSSKIYPVCLHPKFGGWFALRAVLIFPQIQATLRLAAPLEILSNPDQISELLNLYNHSWQDNQFWDCAPKVIEKYLDNQRNYFALKPGNQRNKIVD